MPSLGNLATQRQTRRAVVLEPTWAKLYSAIATTLWHEYDYCPCFTPGHFAEILIKAAERTGYTLEPTHLDDNPARAIARESGTGPNA